MRMSQAAGRTTQQTAPPTSKRRLPTPAGVLPSSQGGYCAEAVRRRASVQPGGAQECASSLRLKIPFPGLVSNTLRPSSAHAKRMMYAAADLKIQPPGDPENAEMKGFVKTATDEIAAQKLATLRVKEAEDGADKLMVSRCGCDGHSGAANPCAPA